MEDGRKRQSNEAAKDVRHRAILPPSTLTGPLPSSILHPLGHCSLQIQWLGDGVLYEEAFARQEEAVAEKIAAPDATPDRLLLLEHAPVYTIGRTPERGSLGSEAMLPHPLHTVGRGGQATYHGPGQLVGYPILDLSRRGRDLHRHLRFLEEALITTLADYGVQAGRREGLTGVWIGQRKIASLGVGVRRWVSFHGFAINVTRESLLGFQAITPCGIAGVTMTSVAAESGAAVTVKEFADVVAARFRLAWLAGG